MKEETLQSLCARRSIRKYKPDQITDEALDAVLRAGTYAPSGMGKQSGAIVVVQDRDTRDLLSRLNAQIMGSTADPFYGTANQRRLRIAARDAENGRLTRHELIEATDE